MRSWQSCTLSRGLALALAVAATGCITSPKVKLLDLNDIAITPAAEEPMPTAREARAVPRVLVLPLANRVMRATVGRMHNALDDLFRRDLMCIPTLSVFPASSSIVPAGAARTPGYRSLEIALQAGRQAGATHVIIGEIAVAEKLTAIEVDFVDVHAEKVLQTARIQAPTKRLRKHLPKLREQVLAFFNVDLTTVEAEVPGFTPSIRVLERLGRGQNLEATGDLSQALVEYYAAAGIEKPFVGAYLGIASVQNKLGAQDIADRAYRLALVRDPDYVEAYWRFALTHIQGQTHPGPAALRLCQEASRRAPYFGPAHLTLGTLWYNEKKNDHADRHFLVAHELMPRSVWPLHNRAGVLQMRGDLQGARALLEQAVRTGPGEARLHEELGLLLRELGDDEAALTHLKRAADLDQSNPLYLFNVGEQFHRLGQPKPALAAYRAAGAYPFNSAWLSRQLGQKFFEAGALSDAERALAEGYAKAQQDGDLVLLYARVLLHRARDNRIRRPEYAARARMVLTRLHPHYLTEAQRVEASLLITRLDQLTR